jgi:hypothetical protein
MISPPKCCTMLWCPKHTPSTGILPAKAPIIASELPASSGRPGPGEITRCVGSSFAASATVSASLR